MPAAQRAAIAGLVGTFIEYYDYTIFRLLPVQMRTRIFYWHDHEFWDEVPQALPL